MDHDNNAPRSDEPRNASSYDDNRDNRMPENRPDDYRDDVSNETHAKDQAKDRGPSMIAYSVKDRGQDQDSIWKSVGAAFPHRDGKGMDVVLDAVPVDGRVTLREQRKQEFKEQRNAGTEQNQDRTHNRSQEHHQETGQARSHRRGPSRNY